MVRHYKRKTERANYGSEKLIQIVNALKKGDIRLAGAVRDHGIAPEIFGTPEILNAKKQRACPGSSSQVDKSKFLKGLEKKPKRKFKIVDKENDQVQSICANCYVEFESGKNGDFIKCRICQLWVCENCYCSECCVNCGE